MAAEDDRLDAVLMYGSFADGEGDEHSDVEFYVFVAGGVAEGVAGGFDPCRWVAGVAPVRLCYENEYGITAVIFDGLVRGEFHFEPAAAISRIERWPGVWFPSVESCVLYDRGGRLTEVVARHVGTAPDRRDAGTVAFLASSVANWLVDGLRRRGEVARAHAFLHLQVHPHLLRLARVHEGVTANWLSPTRRLEEELSPAAYRRYAGTVATLDAAAVDAAVADTWRWFRELLDALGGEFGSPVDPGLLADLDQRFT